MRVSATSNHFRIIPPPFTFAVMAATTALAGFGTLATFVQDAAAQGVGTNFRHVSDHSPQSQRSVTNKLSDVENFNEPLANKRKRVQADESSASSPAAQREITRRMEMVEQARALMKSADELVKQNEYEAAVGEYRTALDVLPDSDRTAHLRREINAKYADASVELAVLRAEEGRYDESISLCEVVLDPAVSPNHGQAQILLKWLQDPKHFNQALTPEHVARVKRVEEALRLAMGHYDLGDFDSAQKEYYRVLNIDRYNSGARRGLETNERAKMEYYKSAYDQTRARALREVMGQWESTVPRIGLEQVFEDQRRTAPGSSGSGLAYISAKLKEIVIPVISFQDTPLEEAVEFLRQRSVELDTLETNPSKKGVNIIIQGAATGGGAAAAGADLSNEFGMAPAAGAAGAAAGGSASLITLNLTNVPLVEALKYVTELAGRKYKIDPYAVKIIPLSEIGADLYTSVFSVPPNFLNLGGDTGGGGGAPEDPFAAPSAGGGGTALKARPSAKEVLMDKGISFPPGSSAFFNPTTSQLVARNTQGNMELIETFVDSLIETVQKQIHVAAKFVEIEQKNLEELSFDYLLAGGVTLGNNNKVLIGGGTQGNVRGASAPSLLDFPIPVAAGSPLPATTPAGVFPVSAGLRSGDLAISQNSIDSLISSAASGAAAGNAQRLGPAVFSVAGVLTNPQFQAVMRAVEQKSGVDLLSAPSITARSGQRAQVEVIREFIYPTEYDPPEIPDRIGNGAGAPTGSVVPITPANPTAFETRNTGVTLEVDPVIGADGYTIDLNIVPEVVEFQGFVNYGSVINSVQSNSVFNTAGAVPAFELITRGLAVVPLSPNQILMPVFETRKVSTSVTLWDGQTVALGGLIREDVESVNDKVPLLGDVPFFGKFFQSKVDLRRKKHLSIFVTANLINPAGQRIRPVGGNAALGAGAGEDVIEGNPLVSP